MSTDDTEELGKIRANADLAIEQFGPASGQTGFGYTPESVKWVEGFIERQRVREDASPEFVRGLVNVIGSYLGECIIRCHGGRWTRDQDGWFVAFDARNAVYPFSKVEKQFANGREDGIHSFFTLIPIAFQGRSNPATSREARRQGWLRSIWRRLRGR